MNHPATVTKPYKILIAHYRSDIISGAENSITDLVLRLNPRFQITMFVPKEGKVSDFFRSKGISVWVREVSTPRRRYPGLHLWQSFLLSNELKKRAYDAVICNTYPAASRVGLASRICNIPYAIYMRDYLPDSDTNRQVLSKANAFFAISKDVITRHQSMADHEKFHLAYNYIDSKPILQRAAKHRASNHPILSFPDDSPTIGWIGRITPYKQPELFIRAASLVLNDIPSARFIIVGSAQDRDKPYEQELHTLVNQLGLNEKVVFMGQRSDTVEIISELALSCLTSAREPLGRVILESNLLGIPVIVPDTGGPAEIVDDEETGLHFSANNPDSPNQLAVQIVRLLSNEACRTKFANAAYQKMMRTFASQRHIQVQENLIEQLCKHQFPIKES